MKIFGAGSLPGAAAFIAFFDINFKKIPVAIILRQGAGRSLKGDLLSRTEFIGKYRAQARADKLRGLVMVY